MIKNYLRGFKGCSEEDLLSFRGQFHFPVERIAVLCRLMKFPGLTIEELRQQLDIEKTIIKDVVADLYDQDRIRIDISGRLFLADIGGL